MIIKEALLQEELLLIEKFLLKFDLKLDKNLTKTFYIETEKGIIGTISCDNYIIKCLAVDPEFQSENLATVLINHIIDYFRINNIFNYQVFTKPIYKDVFESLGFKEIVRTEKVIMLEGGANFIDDKINEIRNIIVHRFGNIDETSDIGCVVINGNPITNGHMHLIEEASINHRMVILFVVEEDKSDFSFEERFSFAYLSTFRLGNVCVIPSSKYIVSQSTFPSYFLKNEEDVINEYCIIDALIFEKYFVKKLHIKKRYVGQEFSNKMINYNNTLKNILSDKLVVIDRIKLDDEIISASKVRELLKSDQLEEALKYIPREIHILIKSYVVNNYGNA